jgi:CelD/BcsL family acetyltransferase involved in cellulose biosynthesis
MRLHVERFGSRSAVFATTARRSFHLAAARRFAERGLARIYALEVAGHDAALLYALQHGTRLYYYSMGMRADLGGSPGRTVLGQALLQAAAEGFTEFDLLRGDHDFKLRFSSGVRADAHTRLLRPTTAAGLALAGRGAARLLEVSRFTGPRSPAGCHDGGARPAARPDHPRGSTTGTRERD